MEDYESIIKDPKSIADYSQDAANLIAKANTLKDANRLPEATELLAPLEKKARNACDAITVAQICVWVIESYFTANMWDEACASILAFSKKRGQLKRPIVEMVQHAMQWLDRTPSEAVTYKLIEVLCTVTEGKIFVEVERARIVMRLCKMKEAEGNLSEASALLQEVQVETSIAMDKLEKAHFILEQMRLVLAREDYIRCQIVSKRINRKLLSGDEFQMIKLRYYSYMALFYLHQEDYFEMSNCMSACLETPIVRGCVEKPEMIDMHQLEPFLPANFNAQHLAKWYLEAMVFFLLLSFHSPERADASQNLLKKERKALLQCPAIRNLLVDFLSKDVIAFPPAYASELAAHPLLSDSPFPGGAARQALVRRRAIQHNMIVVSKYYKRGHLKRFSELFDVSVEEVEDELCELIMKKVIKGRINRPSGLIVFGDRESERDRMNEWSRSISRMLEISEEASNLLEKEKLLQSTLAGQRKAGVR